MSAETETTSAALRMWLDPPNLMASYERRGIVIITIGLRREAAVAAATNLAEMIAEQRAAGVGDSDRLDILEEVAVMMREVLGGVDGQILPLDLDRTSPLDELFGAVS